MARTKSFRAVRPLKSFDSVYPEPFDPREKVFVPDRSIGNAQISDVNIRKVQVYAAKVYNSGTQAIVADGTYQLVTFDTEEYDEGGFWTSGSASRFTIPFQGVYTISGYVAFDAAAGGLRRVRLLLNGSTALQTSIVTDNGGGTETPVFISAPLRLMEGDYIQLQARQNQTSAANLNILGGSDDNFFAIALLGVI